MSFLPFLSFPSHFWWLHPSFCFAEKFGFLYFRRVNTKGEQKGRKERRKEERKEKKEGRKEGRRSNEPR